ncbi:MAG: nitroreductase family protein [Novibacillus thermophilus]|jgi:putative NAD(P)H nitroreductase
MDVRDTIEQRRAVKRYDPTREISEDRIRELFRLASLAPSAWNLQHWHFIVVRSAEQKERLRKAANNQPKVTEASLTVVVCGNLDAYRDADRIYDSFVRNGYLSEEQKRRKIIGIEQFYADPQNRRDEAIRNASLAAQTLILAATEMGYATCPMIGFDPDAVREVVELPDHLLPVMLITVGFGEETRPRNDRKPFEEIVDFEVFGRS